MTNNDLHDHNHDHDHHHHGHDHSHDPIEVAEGAGEYEIMVHAMKELLIEKGVITSEDIRKTLRVYGHAHAGARRPGRGASLERPGIQEASAG